MSRACCFTGHRVLPPECDPAFSALTEALDRAIDEAIVRGCTEFYAGGAVGFDMLAAEAVQRRKAQSPALRLTLCVPYLGHNAGFSASDQSRFTRLKESADRVLILSDHYTPSCYRIRNLYMVEHCDLLIAYVRRAQSGSGQTYAMAKKRGLAVILL